MEYIKIKIDVKREEEKDRIYFLNKGHVRPSVMNFFRPIDADTSNQPPERRETMTSERHDEPEWPEKKDSIDSHPIQGEPALYDEGWDEAIDACITAFRNWKGKPQRQDSLTDQMETILNLARKEGCYDAQDWIKQYFFDRQGKRELDKTKLSIRLREYDINTLMQKFKNGELTNSNPVIDAIVDATFKTFRRPEIGREELIKILMKPSNNSELNVNYGVVNECKAEFLASAILKRLEGGV